MIKSFKCKETEKIFNTHYSGKFPHEIQIKAAKKLWMIDAAKNINDIRTPPSNHLEMLRGKRKGQHSIRINLQWRICFTWKNDYAQQVEIIDYH